ncbi:6-glucan-6-glucanohydrolase) (Endodextranase) [Durusdinium trenchii]|uniref:6-glucan-6-glucanohydrolase (Endodextranase n=1 Tax=Durusdinium trenchii TaxID=1381693 RepID=A0ABP0K5M3_9DINO
MVRWHDDQRARRPTGSWTHCLYSSDIWLEVTIQDDVDHGNFEDQAEPQKTIDVQVTIRPRSIVQTAPSGYWTIRLTLGVVEQPLAVCFVEPIAKQIRPEDLYSPEELKEKVYYVDPERDFPLNLDQVTQPIIYFRPGIYAMAWNYHAYLPNQVEWIYLAPGSYVKGAFQFRGETGKTPNHLRVTGAGTLSGEKYVYECDKENGYRTRPADLPGGAYEGRCLKMLEFWSPADMEPPGRVQGITLTNPQFHTFTVYGTLDSKDAKFATQVNQYHMVGTWYFQTDGLEVPSFSCLEHSFFQSGDDCIKLYWSDVTVRNITCWFQGNGGLVQFGWKPRNLARVLCEKIQVIHDLSRFRGASNCAIICGADLIVDSDKHEAHHYTIEDLTLRDIQVEGRCMCPIRIVVQSKIQKIKIENLFVEMWDGSEDQCTLRNFDKNLQLLKGNPHVTDYFKNIEESFLEILNFRLGKEPVARSNAESLGRLNFDSGLHGGVGRRERGVPVPNGNSPEVGCGR